MIRITFLVGGGKLSRSKYDAKAMQTVTSTLKQLDYTEDRGASCVLECGGCYKTQHDTNKNVLTVVVFPKVDGGKDNNNQQTNCQGEEYEPLIPTNSPGYKLALCSLNPTFHNLLSTYCPTYLEKKECQSCIEGLLQVEQAIENKLTKGQPLDAGEQAFYDESQDLKEKYTTVQKEASKHVEDGRLTVDEKAILVEMNEKRIQTLMAEKSSASVAEKLKKAMTRKQQLQSSDDVLSMNVSYPPPLRHESQLTTLRKKLLPLYALEEASRGRLLTLNETRLMTEKEEIEAEIERLELNSCGWFEQEEVFEERLQRSREKFDAKFARSKRSGGGSKVALRSGTGGKGGGGNSVSKWILPGEKPKSTWGGGGKKKAKPKGGAVFTAYDAMMDSSSDEESDDNDEEDSAMETKAYSASSPKKQHPASSNVLTPKNAVVSEKKENNTSTTKTISDDNTKAKKKKKNKKKKKKVTATSDDQDIEKTTDEPLQKVSNQDSSSSSVSSSLVVFWQSFLLPLVTMILNLIVYLVTSVFNKVIGKKDSKNKKRR